MAIPERNILSYKFIRSMLGAYKKSAFSINRGSYGSYKNKKMKKELVKVSTYAKLKGVKRQTIYYHIRKKAIKPDYIDGVLYIDVNKYPVYRNPTYNEFSSKY